jgi:putative heme-binding domain-containing protein
VEDSFPTRLLKKLHSMAGDPSPRVRYQLAFTLGGFDDRERIKPLERIIRRDADDRWVRAAVLSSLTDDAGRMFEQIIDREWSRASGGGFEFVRSLVRMIGARNRSNEVASVLERLAGIQSPKAAFPVATSLGQGLEDAGCTLAQADIEGRLGPLYAAAKSWALAEPASPDSPVSVDPKEAIEFLGKGPFSNAAPTLRAVLTNTAGAQPAAIQALVGFKEPVAGEILLESWSYLTPDLRPRMVDAMMRRTERVSLLLAAIEAGEIRPHDLNPSQTDTLRKHRDPMIRERASKLLAQPETTREDLVRSFLPSLQMRGDPGKGKQIYLDRCASCHRIGSQGHALGPDLMSVKTAGKEKLLVNILDPNREVAPNYVSYSVETKSGESLTGLMVVETANSVSLHGPNGVETLVLRSQIGRLQSSGRSLMPEGLEAGLTPQDMADLIDYLGVGDE